MVPTTSLDNVERRKMLSLPRLEHRPVARLARSHVIRNLQCIMHINLAAFLPNVIIVVSTSDVGRT
jgi:hypothetical protein